jgi:hypothetical protein
MRNSDYVALFYDKMHLSGIESRSSDIHHRLGRIMALPGKFTNNKIYSINPLIGAGQFKDVKGSADNPPRITIMYKLKKGNTLYGCVFDLEMSPVVPLRIAEHNKVVLVDNNAKGSEVQCLSLTNKRERTFVFDNQGRLIQHIQH